MKAQINNNGYLSIIPENEKEIGQLKHFATNYNQTKKSNPYPNIILHLEEKEVSKSFEINP